MNLSMKEKQTHGHREQICGHQGGGLNKEIEASRCQILSVYTG